MHIDMYVFMGHMSASGKPPEINMWEENWNSPHLIFSHETFMST